MPETNPILQSLYARKSVRVFEEKAIPAGMKQAILEAAAQAPSAGCQQLYTILDITDPALKAALADSCDHQPFIAKAPLVLVFCADCRKWYDAYKEAGCTPRTPGVGDLMLAVTDTAIAAQNAVVAAESFGIGSCYIGDIMENCDTQRSLLHLPDYVFPAVMLVFGWPTQQQKDRGPSAAPWSISCTKTATAPWTAQSCGTPSATRLATPPLTSGAPPSATASITPIFPRR